MTNIDNIDTKSIGLCWYVYQDFKPW